MKKLILLNIFLLLFATRLYADDYYWVGGAGNWTDLSHWATTSGGPANKSIVPGINDDVYFNASSGLAANNVVTMPIAGHAYCRNMSWAGVTTTAIFRNTGSYQLHVYGNLELAATVRYAIMVINFTGSGNATFRTNGAVRINTVGLYNSFILNKPGGSLTLLDGIAPDLAIQNVVLTAGHLNLSGQSHTIGNLSGNSPNVRSIDISNAAITVTSTWDTRGTNATLTATGSTITADMFHSTGLTFAKVFPGRNNPDMEIVGNTFQELTFTNTAAPVGTLRIGANNTIGRLEFKGGGRLGAAGNVIGTLILAPGKGYIFHGNNTINTLMQANSADCDALGELTGADANARLTFGAGAAADIRNVLITSLTAAGSIAPITVVGEDGGSNVGFNITPRTGGNTTLYWVGGGGEWDDKAHWSTSSGGPGGACVPFTTDNVIFDANSGFTNASKTVTTTSTTRCHNMTWTNVTNSPILDMGAYRMEIWGSVVLSPTVTLKSAQTQYVRGVIQMKGTEASTFTSNGCNLGNPLFNVEKTGAGGLTISDDLTFPACSLRVASGHLLMPGRTVNIAEFRSQTTTVRTIDFSNATIIVNDWAIDSRNATAVNSAGSFITAKVWFVVNGFSYPKVYSETTVNSVNITGTTIDELVFTNTSPTTDVTALSGNGGNTIGTLEVRCGGVDFRGDNTINTLLLAPSRTYYFKGTQTITGLFRFNSPACNGLGELRNLDGTPSILTFGPSSTQDFNNVYLQNITATGSGVPISVSGADAGGNTGFNITPSASGPRYWVGGAGNWNESAHWSTTSGGTGGACVPTVANDVYFDASSFTSGSNTVTISEGNAFCRNMDWTGATFSPVFTKTAFNLEVWGNVTLNNTVTINAQLYLTGSANSTFTSNGNTLGNLDLFVYKSAGYSLRFMDNFSNPRTRIDLRYGGIDMAGRTITLDAISDGNQTGITSLNITNATINAAAWEYQGASKTLQASGSVINAAGYFAADDAAYNIINTGTTNPNNLRIVSISAKELIFTSPLTTSGAQIHGGNTIGKLEFKGRGYIAGTGNTIDTLIFSPGKVYTFLSGSNNTITKEWFGSGTPCNLTEITSSATGAFTVTKTAGEVEFDYVRLRGVTAAGITPFKALEHSENLGNNTNWNISPYNGSTPILGLGPDVTLCANEFPYTLNTDGFFASPQASFLWSGGSTGKTLVVNAPGTYSVTVSYPDACTRTDAITITRSDVIIDPITGTAAVCEGKTTTLASTTPGGVWSTSNAAIATVSTTGVVSGVAAGTANIIYTVTNGNGCSNSQQLAVTVNATPVVNAITGTLSLFQGGTTTLSNTTPAGVWASSNTAVATVDGSGIVTGVAGGTADITYTVTNASGCMASQTVTVTVDAFPPAKRILSITKTADAQEPVTNGGFSINLPAGALAVEDISITYTISGTATSTADYTALSGTAVITAGQNGVPISVSIVNDAQIESTETVIVTLSTGTSTNYTYTIDGAAGNATVQIADDDDIPDNRLLSVTAQLHANEPVNTGTFTIALPSGVLAPEDITVAYTMSGTSTNGVDYETLSGTATITAGQNSVVINVKAVDDQIIEQTKNIILTLTGGTTATAGNFGVDATNGAATLLQADNDYTTATRLLAVTANGNPAEPTTHGGFTISLPTGYVSSLPITVTYTFSGTAANGVDYNAATTVTLPAGQNSVPVPVNVINDNLIELSETVILTITNGVANQGGSAVFTLSPDPATPNATINIADDDNTAGNRTLAVSNVQNGAEPSTNGSFTINLPAGVLASEDITVSYTVSGTAVPGTDYNAITGSIIIPAGKNNVQVPLNVIDNKVIEITETVILTVSGGTSASFSYTAATANSGTADITDDDAASNLTVVLLTKVSDAVEGGTNGQYRISLPPGITSSEDITVLFGTSGTAAPVDYTLLGISGGNIVIPAGTNEVFIDVNAPNDGAVEGPETVVLTLTNASSPSHAYTIDAAGNGATVNIVDANAATTTPLQVIAGTNTAEGGANGSFTVQLAGGATSTWPVTVAYRISGTATSGLDYQSFGTIVIPAGAPGSVGVTVNAINDQIIEPTETVVFTILNGSATDGAGNAFLFPPDPANEQITVNIADNDATTTNRVLTVVKTTDAAEPGSNGSYTVSLPAGYSSGANITLNYSMTGSAGTPDYSISTITLPAYSNSVIIPLLVNDDKIIEGTETATFNLAGGTDGNTFTYTTDPATVAVNLAITDDDNTTDNRKLSVVTTAHTTEGSSTNGRFTIKLPPGITASTPITVNYTIDGSAIGGIDYSPLMGTNATIPANADHVDVLVVANGFFNDNIIEATETVTMTITGGTDGTNTFTPAAGSETALVNIADDDASVAANRTLRIVKTSDGAEQPLVNGAFRIEFAAGAGIRSSEDITVNYTIAGTAINGTDYATLSGSIVLPAGSNSVPVNVLPVNDWIMEPTETVTLTLTGGTSASFNFPVGATPTASLNITDDDNIAANRTLTLTKTADAAEPGTNGSIRISLPPNFVCPVNINVSLLPTGTATGGADYLNLPAVFIPAGKNYVDVPITVINDNLIENTETVVLSISGSSTAGFPFAFTNVSPPVTVNIADDDNTPANRTIKVTLNRDGAEGVAGANGGVRFDFHFPQGIASSEIVTVNYTITGTAVKGTDYNGLTPAHFSGTWNISAGQNAGAIASTTVDDQIIEGTETVVITLTSASSGSFTFGIDPAAGSATGRIIDNDNAPANLELFVTKTTDATEPGTDGAFSVKLAPGVTVTEPVTVNYTITGTATNGTDYVTLNGSVVIPANQPDVAVPVTLLPDQIIENMETVVLTITGGTSPSYTFTPNAVNASATVNITDDENTPANLVLSISKVNDASEPSTPGRVTFALPGTLTAAEDISVTYTVAGTATADADYAALSGTVIIPAGESSITIPVSVINDKIIEPLETVVLTLTGGNSTGIVYTGTGNVTVNISDDDNIPDNLVLNVTRNTDAEEPNVAGSFIISLPEDVTATEDITVTFATGGTATTGSDYNDLSGLIVIPAGSNSISVPVTVIDDYVLEGTETVTLELTGGSSTSLNLVPGTDKTASLDILDNDLDPTNMVLSISQDKDGTEPGTSGNFIISLPLNIISSEDITVNYTVSGTAASGSDYTALSGSVIIPAGSNSVAVSVDVMNDFIIEPTETVIATLTGGSSANMTFTGNSRATVNIADDESTVPANLELTVSKGSDASEPSANGSFVISLPATMRSSEDITVNYTISGTAASGTDYIALSGTAVIPAGSPDVTVPVTVQNDDILEGTETVILTLNGGTSAGITFTGTGNATVNITDDENVPAKLVLNAAANGDASETATAGGFTISLPGNITSATDITANYTITGTAIAGTDYIALTGSVVIPAGRNSVTIPVTGIDDQLIEGNETIVLTITGGTTTGFVLTPGTSSTATINLADDDTNLNIVVSATTHAAEPNTAGAFTISLASGKLPVADVTVTYTISGTATAGTDYTTLTGSAVIPAGSNSVVVPLNVMDDNLFEPVETVIITLTGGSSPGITYTIGAANQATVNITSEDVAAGDLSITKEIVQPLTGPYRLGQEITYRITVRNIGTGPASGVAVTDTLALQLGLPASTNTSIGQVNVAANKVVTWTIGDVTPGASMQLEISCRIIEGGNMLAGAEVGSGTTDPDLTNNKAVLRLQIEGNDLTFPNTFSPNGDGKNEKFVIGGIEKYPGSKLQVFNRWGGQVYRSNDYRNDWNGSDLLESTYYYILEVKKPDGIKAYKGWVLIVR